MATLGMSPYASGLSRRRFLGVLAAGGAAGVGTLAGCGNDSDPMSGSSPVDGAPGGASDALPVPTYKPVEYVEADLPRADAVDPGYLRYPSKLVKSVTETPGAGSTLTAMVGIAGAPPAPNGSNRYHDLVNGRLGADVTFNYVPLSEYSARLATVMAGDVPDLLQMLAWQMPNEINDAAPALFTELTEYLGGDAALEYPNLANVPTVHWQSGVFAGRLFGIPSPGPLLSSGYFYRADIFDAAGLQPPTSAAELEAICEELNDPGSGRWAMGTPYQRPAMWMFRSPSTWRMDSDALVRSYETDEFAAAVEWARKIHDADYVHPEISTRQSPRKKELFYGGQAPMITDGMGAWMPGWAQQAMIDPDFRMLAMPPFAADGGEPIHYAPDADDPNAYYTFIKKGLSKERVEEILRVLNFCAAPIGTEEYHLIQYGDEGVHHTFDANGAPVRTDLGKEEIGRAFIGLAHPPQATINFGFPEAVEAMHAWQEATAPYAVASATRGINVTKPTRLAAIDQSVEDTVVDIVLGRSDMSALQAAVDTWRSSGGDELRALYQDALAS